MNLEKTFHIAAPAKKVMDLMRQPELIEEDNKSRHALSVSIKDLQKTKDVHEFEVHTENYARGLTGINKSKTETDVVTINWNLKEKNSTWKWRGSNEMANKATITGATVLKEKSGGTDAVMTVDVDIPVPVIGKRIAKVILAEFEKQWPNYIALLNGKLKK